MSTPVARSSLPGTGRTARFEGADFGSGSSFFWVRNDPGKGVELHRHPYTETFILSRGTANFSIDGIDSVAVADEVVVEKCVNGSVQQTLQALDTFLACAD